MESNKGSARGVTSAQKPRTWRITKCHGAETASVLRQKLEAYEDVGQLQDITLAHLLDDEPWGTATCIKEPSESMQHKFGMDDEFIGITPLADGQDPSVDIIVVPGLGTHPLGSFRSKKNMTIWLRDLLPSDIPKARLLLYGYHSQVILARDKSSIQDLAKTMLQVVLDFRTRNQITRRPIIFVAHSLGGLLVKEALALALDDSRRKEVDEDARDMLASTSAVVLFGVPQQSLRDHELATAVKGQPNSTLIHDLVVDGDSEATPFLKMLGQRFRECLHHQELAFEVIPYYERDLSPTLQQNENGVWARNGPAQLLVTQASACDISTGDSYPLSANHSDMVKYHSKNDVAYRAVFNSLAKQVRKAPERVSLRFTSTSSTGRGQYQTLQKGSSNHTQVETKPKYYVDFSSSDIPAIVEYVERDEMHDMESFFFDNETDPRIGRQVLVLHGAGGIGKTQLAVKFVRKHQSRYSAVLWLHGLTEEYLAQSIVEAARRIPHDELGLDIVAKLNKAQHEPGFVEEVLKDWLGRTTNNHWLLVVDRVDKELSRHNHDPAAYDIKKFLPLGDHGSILITSRLTSLAKDLGTGLAMKKMDDTQAQAVLENAAGKHIEDAISLVHTLDGLPIALAQAGWFLKDTNISTSDYVQRYQNDWGNLMRRQNMSSPNQNVERNLLTTWSASCRSVRRESEEAAGLMRLWDFLDGDDVWYELIAGACDLELGEVKHCPGLQPSVSSAKGRVSPVSPQHGDLPHLFRPPQLSPDPTGRQQQRVSPTRSMNDVNKKSTSADTASSSNTDPTYYHGQTYIPPRSTSTNSSPEEFGEWGERMNVPQWLHNLASHKTVFMDAVRVLLRHSLLESREQTSSYSMHPVIRKWCMTIVDESEKLDLLKLAMGIVSGLNVQWEKEDYESWVASQRRYQHVLKVHARWRRAVSHGWNRGSRNVGWLLRIYHNLGFVLYKMMDLHKATQMLEQSVDTRECVLGREHPLTLSSVCLLSRAYTKMGRVAKAEEILTRVEKAYSKRGDIPDLRVAEMRCGLGKLYYAQNKLSEAESLYRSAISLVENRHGSEHEIIANATFHLGRVYETQGQLTKAEHYHLRALAMDEKRLGAGNANAFSTILYLGNFYQSQGRFSEAADQFRRTGEAWRKPGSDFEHAYYPWYCLGRVYWQQGLLTEAKDMMQYASLGYQKQRGKFGYFWTGRTASYVEKIRKGQAFEW